MYIIARYIDGYYYVAGWNDNFESYAKNNGTFDQIDKSGLAAVRATLTWDKDGVIFLVS